MNASNVAVILILRRYFSMQHHKATLTPLQRTTWIGDNQFETKFGSGVSFSPSAAYVNIYCNGGIGSSRALIVARILVGISHEGDCGTKLPCQGYDTTVGNCEQVYVKYYDNEFYPQHVV